MDILLVGGTGFIGRPLSRALHEAGHEVTVLGRSPEVVDLPSGITTVAGDVTDYESIIGAFDEIDAVVNLVALSPLFKPKQGEQMHDVVHRQGTQHVVRAAEAQDVTRIVQLSAIEADPDGDTAYLRAKGEAETIVRDSGLESVVIRPSVVFGNEGEFISFIRTVAPPYLTPLPGGGKMRFQPIWVSDLVPMIADAVTEEVHTDSMYEIAGPETYTLAEIAEMIHASAGQTTNVLPMPTGLVRIGMAIGGVVPGFPFGPDQYRSLQKDLIVESNDITEFDFTPNSLMTLSDFLDTADPSGSSHGTETTDQTTQSAGRTGTSD